MIDDCGVISTARRLEADGLRSMYPEGVHRRIAAPSTSHGLPRGGRTPRQEVRRAGLRGSDARGSIGASDGTSERTSEPRPRIGGMLEDADLDGLLRLGGRADPPTHQSGGRYTQSAPCRGARHLAERSVKAALGRKPPGGYAECVPRPRRDLTTTEKRHLHSLEGRISRLEAELQATRREWAELVEEAGQAAVARELGVSRQAIADRLRRIRANREGRSDRR